MRSRPRIRDQAGTALVEVTWLSILLLVPLLYIVLAAFEVQRASFAVSAATRAAGRAYSLAPGEAVGLQRARGAVALVLRDHGLDVGRSSMSVACTPAGSCLAPGSVLTVDIAYPVALPLVPVALGADTPSIRVAALHRVPYGTFRDDRS